jgi:MFS family permease
MRSAGRPLVAVCLFAFFGFGLESVIAPVLPLLVVDRGGNAALVGILVATFGLPSIVLRPFLGRWLDTPWRPRIVIGSAAIESLAPLGYLVAALPMMVLTRAAQGVGWAAYGTSGHAILARIAPKGRRGEAAGYYNAMPALALLLGPTTGLWLFANVGESAPFVLSAALGLAGLAVTIWLPLAPGPATKTLARPTLVAGLFDRSAIVPMVLVAMFMSVQSLFVIFAPLYARTAGIPIAWLGIYYPTYGIVVLLAQLVFGRVSDRIGRWPTIAVGCSVGVGGLLVAGIGGGLGGLLAGACLYGLATALMTSAVGALAMESAPPDRTGAAMATYSLGYQLGASVGGAAWGALISLAGYPWPFFTGAAVVGTTLALAALMLPHRLVDTPAAG